MSLYECACGCLSEIERDWGELVFPHSQQVGHCVTLECNASFHTPSKGCGSQLVFGWVKVFDFLIRDETWLPQIWFGLTNL